MAFTGFSDQTLRYFLNVRENNSREYFQEHRQDYEEFVRNPLNSLYAELAEFLYGLDGELVFTPGRCISTPYADARFCGGRPLKEYMYLRFRPAWGRKENIPGFFFDSSTDGVRYGLRIYHLTSKGMEAVRGRFCAEEKKAQKLIEELERWGKIALHGDSFQRDHYGEIADPLKDWLNRKRWELYFEQPVGDSYYDGRLAEEMKEVWQEAAPLYRMIKEGLAEKG